MLTTTQAINAQWCRKNWHLLNPNELNDGRWVVSVNAKTDPLYAPVWSVLSDGSEEAVSTSDYVSVAGASAFRPKIGGLPVFLASDTKAHSLQMPADNRLDFELHPSDQGYPTDPVQVRHRSEVIAQQTFAFGIDLWVSWSFRINQYGGLDVPGNYSICGQWHMSDVDRPGRPPPFSFNFSNGKLQIFATSDSDVDDDGNGVFKTRYTAPSKFGEGQWRSIVAKVKMGLSGSADVWVDGVSAYSASIPIGYYNDAVPTVYPELGIYAGDVNHPDVLAAGSQDMMRSAVSKVSYANIEWGSADLTDRIATPLAVA